MTTRCDEIIYDEYELLELFESEPTSIADDPKAGLMMYSKKDDFGFEIIMTLSIYECNCILSLNYKEYETSIFNFELKNVEKILCKNELLIIQAEGGKQCVEVMFKPSFALKNFRWENYTFCEK